MSFLQNEPNFYLIRQGRAFIDENGGGPGVAARDAPEQSENQPALAGAALGSGLSCLFDQEM